MTIQVPDGKGGVRDEHNSVRNGINEITRLEYAKDCNIGVTRWNMLVKRAGVPFEFKLPSTRFRRSVGAWAGLHTDPQGNPISAEEFERRKDEWLPSEDDVRFVKSLMQRVTQPGKMAGWIAPPDRGINAQPVEYEYVRL
jgi:benzoyl-CoA 2,3-dioxygenase component B